MVSPRRADAEALGLLDHALRDLAAASSAAAGSILESYPDPGTPATRRVVETWTLAAGDALRAAAEAADELALRAQIIQAAPVAPAVLAGDDRG